MTSIKKFCFLVIVLALVMALASCSVLDEILAASQGSGNVTEDPDDKNNDLPPASGDKEDNSDKKEEENDDLPSSGGNKDEENEENNDGNGDVTASKDGLSEDGTYYQLTDKNGVVIRIPVGRPLAPSSNGAISSDNIEKQMRSRNVTRTSDDENSENRSIYIFSELSIYSMGYGSVNNPCESGYILDPAGKPYTVDDQHVVVVQCFNEDLYEVKADSGEVCYINIYVLDYLTDPGNLMFSEIIEYSYAEKMTIYHVFFSNIVFGTPYVQKHTEQYYDEAIGAYRTRYVMEELINLRTPTGVMVLQLKQYECNSDWSTIRCTEYIYDDTWNLTDSVMTDHLGRLIEHCIYENGLVKDSYYRDYYPNGNLKQVSEPDLREDYEEDGTLILRSVRIKTDENSYVWDSIFRNVDGEYQRMVEEYVNDVPYKQTYYHPNSEIVDLIYFFDEEGHVIREEYYTEEGVISSIHTTEYTNGVISYTTYTNYEDGEIYIYGYSDYYPDGEYRYAISHYASGVIFDEMFRTEDGSEVTWILYDEEGEIYQKEYYEYEGKRMVRSTDYFYENGKVVTTNVSEYDLEGDTVSVYTYEGDALAYKRIRTDYGYTMYDYVNRSISYYDFDLNFLYSESM